MEELKTIKDITPPIGGDEGHLMELTKMAFQAQKNYLRAEAIKDVKRISKTDNSSWCPYCDGMPLPCDDSYHKVVISYIKWKFNLSNEDLKNGRT